MAWQHILSDVQPGDIMTRAQRDEIMDAVLEKKKASQDGADLTDTENAFAAIRASELMLSPEWMIGDGLAGDALEEYFELKGGGLAWYKLISGVPNPYAPKDDALAEMGLASLPSQFWMSATRINFLKRCCSKCLLLERTYSNFSQFKKSYANTYDEELEVWVDSVAQSNAAFLAASEVSGGDANNEAAVSRVVDGDSGAITSAVGVRFELTVNDSSGIPISEVYVIATATGAGASLLLRASGNELEVTQAVMLAQLFSLAEFTGDLDIDGLMDRYETGLIGMTDLEAGNLRFPDSPFYYHHNFDYP